MIDYTKLKHGEMLREVFALMVEDWMTEEEVTEFINLTISETGKTLEGMDNDIEIGVANGYSPEVQLEIIKSLHAKHNANEVL